MKKGKKGDEISLEETFLYFEDKDFEGIKFPLEKEEKGSLLEEIVKGFEENNPVQE